MHLPSIMGREIFILSYMNAGHRLIVKAFANLKDAEAYKIDNFPRYKDGAVIESVFID